MHREPAVYILANKKYGTLYVGVTSNLQQRIYQHKNNLFQGFTSKYEVHDLVYFELHDNMEAAITREKQIKKWNRDWKINLITTRNPKWKDLYLEIL
ncbi:MAG: GIY-YIG nuclease family protein [Gammaproteobacteria bacterium]|nr:GIY-YIG nuclease family protein [Gammaproteobacteria bacterium]